MYERISSERQKNAVRKAAERDSIELNGWDKNGNDEYCGSN